MKTSVIAAVVALSGFASAQKKSDFFPGCSLQCLDEATEKATDCALTDGVCWCVQANYEAIYNAGTACVIKACGSDVAIGEVLPAAEGFCSAASSSASAATKTSTSSSAGNVTPAPSTPGSSGAGTVTSTTDEVSTTDSPGAAAATGYMGGAAMLALGALAIL